MICGPMFAGKSETLIARLSATSRPALAVKPALDRRYGGADEIVTHAGRRWPAVATERAGQISELVLSARPGVLGVDEVQFFDAALIGVVRAAQSFNVDVVCAGLELDAFARPFGSMGELLCLADEVIKLTGICARCQAPSTRSQLLIDGRPAPRQDGPIIKVGGAESYEPRCLACHDLASAT